MSITYSKVSGIYNYEISLKKEYNFSMTSEIVSFLILAATIGITGALQPGPLLALIISQSARYGINEGIKVAFAPLITDAPIIIVVLFILSKIAQSNTVVGIISLLGSGYLAHLAYSSLTLKSVKF